MKNNLLVLILIAVIAILVGVGITAYLASNPVVNHMVQQQKEILTLQKKMDQQLRGGALPAGQDLNSFMKKQKALEEKVEALEKKVEALSKRGPSAAAQMPSPPQEDYTKAHHIPLGDAVVKGDKNAPVTIVGFVDFQCPFSARFQPVIDQVLAAYPNKVNYIIKHFPLSFHSQAKPAAKAVLAAGEQGKYWGMAELILKDNHDVTDQKLQEYAKTLGLDINKFNKDIKDKDAQWEKIIQADTDLGMQVDVRGTPTYYVNGRKTISRDLASFQKEIDGILSAKK